MARRDAAPENERHSVQHDNDNSEAVTESVSGLVKWFDPVKGFGFVVADTGGPDILLHVNVLRNYGQNSIADGAAIDVVVQNTERGVQAVEVLNVVAPETSDSMHLSDIADLDHDLVANAPLEPGRVKWFDKGKGFGFANIFGRDDDVFLHIEVLRRSGLSDLQPGEALAMRVIEGKRGQMAAEVNPWEAALNDSVK